MSALCRWKNRDCEFFKPRCLRREANTARRENNYPDFEAVLDSRRKRRG
jgi:hypothetical protein